MNKPLIFISCGQYTDAEKHLGKAIVKMVEEVTEMEAFFAEDVQNLNGLDSNILNALRDCVAFITVMHPRGKINRLDGSSHIRASVWIEQEIAIATYIQRVEHRALPVIAFIHESVGREGIRDLLHLNPITFRHESEVIDALAERLRPWKTLTPSGIRIQLQASARSYQDGHQTRQLNAVLINNSPKRITNYNCVLRVPAGLLTHWSSAYVAEVRSDAPGYRCFATDENSRGVIAPLVTETLISVPSCTQCAANHTGEAATIAGAFVSESLIETKLWIDEKEYRDAKTVNELSQEAEAKAAR